MICNDDIMASDSIVWHDPILDEYWKELMEQEDIVIEGIAISNRNEERAPRCICCHIS